MLARLASPAAFARRSRCVPSLRCHARLHTVQVENASQWALEGSEDSVSVLRLRRKPGDNSLGATLGLRSRSKVSRNRLLISPPQPAPYV
jgi:hypothetical protein